MVLSSEVWTIEEVAGTQHTWVTLTVTNAQVKTQDMQTGFTSIKVWSPQQITVKYYVLTRFLEMLCLCSHFADSISHRHIQLSREPEQSFLPSTIEQRMKMVCSYIEYVWSYSTFRIHSCKAKNQIWEKPKIELNIHLSLSRLFVSVWVCVPGLIASPLTTNSCPQNSWIGSSPWFRSHIRTVLSREALKIHVLPG